ncbi:MAG TPA: hypothetical protein VN698_00900, partial [Bacteroidia bacterium]|nr:hypothetical protein [Bacteroidia bacterium]
MKNITIQIAIILGFAIIISCSSTPKQNEPQQETPKALKDNKLDLEIKSYDRSGNLVEELYKELMDKTPELKKIEDELDALASSTNEATDKFGNYNGKSVTYYNSANNAASTITDTLLQKKMLAIIENSNKQYGNKTA